MKPHRRALIFSTVWPEPDSSAAGVRQMQWIHFFRESFNEVVLISPSKPKNQGDWGYGELPTGVVRLPLPMNDWGVVEVLRALDPELVMFDRFILEEQFGALVYESLPNALVLLETQDLHFVRRAREALKEKWLGKNDVPTGFYQTETALRETAAMERVDFSFVVSSFEEQLLTRDFSLGSERQCWIPFGYEEIQESSRSMDFDSRSDFVWIGNFRHAPNADALRWTRSEIWSGIRANIPHAIFHVFGAYPSQEFMDWNRNPALGIRVHGHAQNLDQVFTKARVNLAPLRFGAGVKGKILEGFRYGVPVVTTPVGAEGLLPETSSPLVFPGKVGVSPKELVEAAVSLHQDATIWDQGRDRALSLMKETYSWVQVREQMRKVLDGLWERKAHRQLPVWRSRILRHELMNSRKYFSKWIEEKEKRLSPKPEDHS